MEPPAKRRRIEPLVQHFTTQLLQLAALKRMQTGEVVALLPSEARRF